MPAISTLKVRDVNATRTATDRDARRMIIRTPPELHDHL